MWSVSLVVPISFVEYGCSSGGRGAMGVIGSIGSICGIGGSSVGASITGSSIETSDNPPLPMGISHIRAIVCR